MLEHLANSYDLYHVDLKKVSRVFLSLGVVLLSDQNFPHFIHHVTSASNSEMKIKIGITLYVSYAVSKTGFEIASVLDNYAKLPKLQCHKKFASKFNEPHEQSGPSTQTESMSVTSLSL